MMRQIHNTKALCCGIGSSKMEIKRADKVGNKLKVL